MPTPVGADLVFAHFIRANEPAGLSLALLARLTEADDPLPPTEGA